jgi:catechol 2,3-dioxygenase-like lactoylglutathione lyase family enzyme
MDHATIPAPDFGRSLTGLTLNLLVPDVPAEAAFLREVLGLAVPRETADFAIALYGPHVVQLHADATYHANPLPSLLPEAGPRGAGAEFRLHETDPDDACARAAGRADCVVLRGPEDRPHGLREVYILSPAGYAWVPSRRS